MKIAFYCDEKFGANFNNFENIGTSGTVNDLIWAAKGLVELGHNVTIFNDSEAGTFGGIKHILTENVQDLREHFSTTQDYDFLVINGWAIENFLDSRLSSVPTIYWSHNYVDEKIYTNALNNNIINGIICVSIDHLSSFLSKRTAAKICALKKASYIYNPVSSRQIAKFASHGNRVRNNMVFAGALRENKGFHDALRIALKTISQNSSIKFIVCGSAGLHGTKSSELFENTFYESKIKPLIEEFPDIYKNNVIFKGKLTRPELFKEMTSAFACLQNPSWDSQPETLGMAIIESQILGTPVVTSHRGGAAESVADGLSGFLIKSKDDSKFIENLLSLHKQNISTSTKMEKGSKIISDRFDYPNIAKQWEQHFKQLQSKQNFGWTPITTSINKKLNNFKRRLA